MNEQFIAPNWHVVLIHFPLALLGAGIFIEIFSCLWPRSTVRSAGRWMVLVGALACIPALTLGIYAFRGIISTSGEEDLRWQQLLSSSTLSSEQWHYMVRHIWFAAAGTVASVMGAILWLACSNEWRRKLYLPSLLLVLGGLVLLAVASWYSGESVYRQGTAVAAVQPPRNVAVEAALSKATTQAIETQPAEEHAAEEHERAALEAKVMYYVPPLQLHALLGGVVVAIALGALGVTLRRWNCEPSVPAGLVHAEYVERTLDVTDELTRREAVGQPIVPEPAAVPQVITAAAAPLYPARIWLVALIAAVCTAVAGLWLNDDWKLNALVKPLRERSAPGEEQRLFAHVAVGIGIVLFTVILALLTRFARRHRLFTIIFSVLLVLALLAQLWLGILMLYDSPAGPLVRFAG